MRGARTATTAAPHLVAALDHTTGTVIGQVQVAARSNEIPAVRNLLAGFDLTGAVVTVDAMHTQTDTAAAITSAGGNYVFTVKGNTPTLHRQLKTLPWKDVPSHSLTVEERGHAGALWLSAAEGCASLTNAEQAVRAWPRRRDLRPDGF